MSSPAPENTIKIQPKRLGKSGLHISSLVLGTMTFGANSWALPTETDTQKAFDILDRYYEAGGRTLDTADAYGPGHSEKLLGDWMASKLEGFRDELVLATKVRFRMGPGDNDVGLSRKHIMKACDDSLARLQTSYIDLYQCHYIDNSTPIEETLKALHDLVESGKVRYIGLSNFPAFRVARAQEIARSRNWTEIISLQMQYSLMCRSTEWDIAPICEEEGLGLLPWSPLCGGWLAGKYKRDEVPESGRVAWAESAGWAATNFSSKNNDQTWAIVEAIAEIAAELGKPISSVSLRWLMQKPGVSAPIIGARRMEHLEDALQATTFELSAEQMERLNKASAIATPYPFGYINRPRG